MVKKVTISIPDDLHKKLDKYRDRIPISSVCAGAIRTAINDIEDCIKEARKRFFLLSYEEACDTAYQKGIRWAGYKATPEELAFVAEWDFDFKGTILEKLADSNNKFEKLAFNESGHLHMLSAFVLDEGYLDDILPPFINDDNDDIGICSEFQRGAQSVWNELKNDLLPKLLDPKDVD